MDNWLELNQQESLSLEFDKDLSGTDIFTFALGQKMLATHQLIQPNCKNSSGELNLSLNGGKAPYIISIFNGTTMQKDIVSNDGKINPKIEAAIIIPAANPKKITVGCCLCK